MAEIVNLRRARKAKSRAAKEEEAAENRARHGMPKRERKLTKARSEQADGVLDSAKLDPEKARERKH